MIDNADCQKAIIQYLKANIQLVTLLGSANEIKEHEYQSQDFIYPSVRVDMGTQEPIGNGTDSLCLSNFVWRVLVYSEYPSSKQCNKILNRVRLTLFKKQINGTDENNNPSFFINHINTRTENASRLVDKIWLGILYCDARITDYNHL